MTGRPWTVGLLGACAPAAPWQTPAARLPSARYGTDEIIILVTGKWKVVVTFDQRADPHRTGLYDTIASSS